MYGEMYGIEEKIGGVRSLLLLLPRIPSQSTGELRGQELPRRETNRLLSSLDRKHSIHPLSVN